MSTRSGTDNFEALFSGRGGKAFVETDETERRGSSFRCQYRRRKLQRVCGA